MRVSFFEEFPTKQNLAKLKYVTWPTTMYVAAKNIKEFKKIKNSITNTQVEVGYWPILEHKEGYWLSPFSSSKAMKRVMKEVDGKKIKVMWDAELPLRHPWLFLRVDNFITNLPRIRKFFKKNGKNILSAEYPIKNSFAGSFLKMMGVSYSPKKYGNKKIVMYYTSMHKLIPTFLLSGITKLHKKYGDGLQVGLGVTDVGILGNEPIIKAKNLKRDLQEMKKIGVKEVVIFRLGGMNEKYASVIKKYVL
jgi:hypothetical protein